jgi:hypothetical protein
VDIVSLQIWKAVKTLPWYVGIPTFFFGSIFGLLALIDTRSPHDGYIFLTKCAAGFGFGLWFIRQLVRAIYTAASLYHRPTAVQILPPR